MIKKNTLFRKGLACAILVLFVSISTMPLVGSLSIENHVSTDHKMIYIKASSGGNTLYVGGDGPGNYTTIKGAINHASDGDTVFVYAYSSPYYEHDVKINKAINLIGEDKDTTIIDAGESGNVIFITADWVNISGFTIQNSSRVHEDNAGIYIWSDYNTITSNIISNNRYGIELYNADSNIFNNNTISNNYAGVYISYKSFNNNFKDNEIILNNENGIKFHYCYYKNNIVDNNISKNNNGVEVYGSRNITINGNIITSNYNYGIHLSYSSNNTITDNSVRLNKIRGICIWSSTNNSVIGNTISDNLEYGILLSGMSKPSDNNSIYHNNFITNEQNAIDDCSNEWDNGYPSGGNYYDDYDGEDNDGDGIGDTPYNISGGDNQDRYPLMEPWSGNRPPTAPIITGQINGKIGVEYQYNFSLSDPDGDSIYLRVDWGNGTSSPWQGPYDSDTTVKLSHTWDQKGTFTIKAQAKDTYGAESQWGTLTVTMPRDKQVTQNTKFFQLFERFTNRFLLFEQIILKHQTD